MRLYIQGENKIRQFVGGGFYFEKPFVVR